MNPKDTSNSTKKELEGKAERGAYPTYSRQSPSPQYSILLNYYRQMHSDGYQQVRNEEIVQKKGADAFPGKKTLQFVGPIRDLFVKHAVKTCLDYGAGKGSHYSDSVVITDNASGKEYKGLKAFWELSDVETWEPGLELESPKGSFDGVICVDVLEHCFAADLPWIVDEIFSLAEKCVFLNIACYPAQAILPNGENVHISVRAPEWWDGLIAATCSKHPGIDYVACCTVGSALGNKQHVWIKHPAFPIAVEGTPALTTQ